MKGTGMPITDVDLFTVCEKFLHDGEGATAIRDWLKEKDYDVTREQVYALIARGIDRGLVRLCPTRAMEMERWLVRRYCANDLANPWMQACVLNVQKPAREYLAGNAAELALSLIKDLGSKKESVHVGLGAGFMTECFARHLAQMLALESPRDLPHLVFHALTSGFKPREPSMAPVCFFSHFMALKNLSTSYIGLFSEPLVPIRNYETVKLQLGVKDAFDNKHEIDIAVTSLSSRKDEHGLFMNILQLQKHAREHLERLDWQGDVQWRPYSEKEALTDAHIEDKDMLRAVTLFELEDFARLAQSKDKYVILIAGPCEVPGCNVTKIQALKPLMTQPSLRVFNRLVTDAGTAQELMD